MAEFPSRTLGELAADEPGAIAIGPFGSRMKAEVYVDQGVPVIRGTNIGGDRALKGDWVYVTEAFASDMPNCIVKDGDLVFPHRGSIGEVALIEKKHGHVVLSTSMMKFRPNPTQADSTFLYYFFRSVAGRHEIMRFASQVGTPGIGQPLTSLRQFKVPLPPIHTQLAIAELLGSLDDKIELNRRTNETLEAMAQAIFRDWFVDFGPTRRKIDGATDPVEVMGGLVNDPDRARKLAALFPSELGEDGLPEGWSEGDLGHYAFLNPESWSVRNAPHAIEYVDLANTKWGTIELTTVYRWSDAPSRARRIVRGGDTIVGTVRPGNGSYSYVGIDGLTASTGFAALRPKEKTMAPLVYLAATSVENIERLDKLADGGAYPAVRPDVVLATNMPIVPLDIVDGFASVCAPLITKVEHNKKENRILAATRDLLLPKLMSGEIRLRDAERANEAVA